jgi:hypothetical protein
MSPDLDGGYDFDPNDPEQILTRLDSQDELDSVDGQEDGESHIMTEPEPATEKQILGMIRFYESGAEFYALYSQTKMADWSRQEAARWREKLKALTPEGASTHA